MDEALNRIYNMDCIEGMERLHAKYGSFVDLVLTDIPFNISKDNNFQTMKDRKGRNGIDFGDWDKGFDEHQLKVIPKLLKPGGSFLVFHSFEQFSILRNVLDGQLEFKDKIIWQKTNPMPRNRDRRWISNIEIASWYVKKGDKWTFNRQNEKYESSVLRYPSESGGGFKRYHPTQKNLEMWKYLMKIHSNKNDIILDPFMGGGTTAEAVISVGENRKFIGFELSKEYYDIANERIGKNDKKS